MKLLRARVTNYRSVVDSGTFEVEATKTIFVGPNEAGKTAILRALQTLNPSPGERALKALRDYPRAAYYAAHGNIDPSQIDVVVASFSVDDELSEALAVVGPEYGSAEEVEVGCRLDNKRWTTVTGVPWAHRWREAQADATKLRVHVEKQGAPPEVLKAFDSLVQPLEKHAQIAGGLAVELKAWLEQVTPFIDDRRQAMAARLRSLLERPTKSTKAATVILSHLPTFVYYSSFHSVRPSIHLAQLAARIQSDSLDVELDFGNVALLKLLNFDAAELAEQGRVATPTNADAAATTKVRDQLDERQYRLDAAAKALTATIRPLWGDEPFELAFRTDGDYLKVVVRDETGVDIELDQRSAGFIWLVSFYVVFKAETADNLANAVLLLDEPGLSLHALRQQEFRKVVSILAERNQTLYTTHSPFMVGTDELDLVRVVEMRDRAGGTKVTGAIVANDPEALFPLQAALGYNLAQSLFAQERNLVCEGLTDLWYVEGVAGVLRAAGRDSLSDKIAIVPAGTASKVVYFATLLHSQRLRVAALLDSDQEGDLAATQDDFVRLLSPKRIHRTKDYYPGEVRTPMTEDLLRETLVQVAKAELKWDIRTAAKKFPTRPIVHLFEEKVPEFSKYKLARAFFRWTGRQGGGTLTAEEQEQWQALFKAVNKSLAASANS